MALIEGTELSEVLVGSLKDSLLYGLEENDTIIGGAGNDTLDGISGSNLLSGGQGSDSFILRAEPKLNNQDSEVSSFYRDTISDFSVSGDEQDVSHKQFPNQLKIFGELLQLNPVIQQLLQTIQMT